MAAPVNDNLANATDLVAAGPATGNTTEATAESGELKGTGDSPTTTISAAGFRTVWYRWKARYDGGPQTHHLIGSAFDTYMSIFEAKSGVVDPVTSHADLQLVASNDDGGGAGTSLIHLTATRGAIYYVQIAGFGASDFGAYTYTYPVPPGPPPAHDNVANADVLVAGTTQVISTTMDATAEAGEVTGDGPSTTTATVSAESYWTTWHRWVAPSTGSATFTTVGTAIDAYLSVFRPKAGVTPPVTSVADLDFLGGNDDGGGGTASSITISAVTGASYYIQVRTADGNAGGPYTLNYPSPGASGPAPSTGTITASLPALGAAASGITAATGTAAAILPALGAQATGTVGGLTSPVVTGTPQAFGFTTSGTVVTYTGGGVTGATTYDLLCINSDNTVTVPEFGAPVESRVGGQGAYIFARQGGTTSATINLGGGINTNTNVLWLRITNTGGLDTTADTGVDSSAGNTTPALTSSTLATATELAVAFAAVHSLSGTAPAALTWSSGYTQQIEGGSGTSSSGVYGSVAIKAPAGTAAETPSASWANGAFPSDRYLLFASFLGAVSGTETGTVTVGLPPLTATVTGTGSATGTATAGLPALQATAAGTVRATGTTAATLPALQAGALGTASATGIAAAILPKLTSQATGTARSTGTVAAVLPALAGTATGTASANSTINAALPALQAAVVGTVAGVTSGAVTVVLPALTGTAAGTASGTGIAGAVLPALTGQVTGTVAATGSAALALPALGAAAVGQAAAQGTTTINLPALQAAATGTPSTINATVTVGLPALTAAATGVASTGGQITVTLPALTVRVSDEPVYVRRPGSYTTGTTRARLVAGATRGPTYVTGGGGP